MIEKVGHRKPNYEALYVLWFLKVFEVLVFEGFSVLKCGILFLISIVQSPFVSLIATCK